MKLLRSLKDIFKRSKTVELPVNAGESVAATGMSDQRVREVVGDARLVRQQLFEHWSTQESWCVLSEGLPLLLGLDPDDEEQLNSPESIEQRDIFWSHLQRCVKQQVPPAILNSHEAPELWRATPVELYRWALAARVPMPDDLEALLGFVSSMVKAESSPTGIDSGGGPVPDNNGLAREQVLSAALAIVLNDLCKTAADEDQWRERVIERLYSGAEHLFAQSEPPLTRPALHDLFDRSLDLARAPVSNIRGTSD